MPHQGPDYFEKMNLHPAEFKCFHLKEAPVFFAVTKGEKDVHAFKMVALRCLPRLNAVYNQPNKAKYGDELLRSSGTLRQQTDRQHVGSQRSVCGEGQDTEASCM